MKTIAGLERLELSLDTNQEFNCSISWDSKVNLISENKKALISGLIIYDSRTGFK